jgi:hypothetical protein
MKKLYFLITFLFLTTGYLSAQVDVVTGLSNPARILLDGTDLYIAESGSGTVSKIDITAALPATATPVVTGITSPYGLYINGTDLYIADIEDGIIYKKDLSDTDPAGPLTTVVSGLSQPGDLAINGDDLYIAEYGIGIPAAVGTSIISRIDLLNVDPGTTLETVITGVEGIGGIVFDGNNLYISSYDNDELVKIDISGFIATPIVAAPGDQVIAGVDQPDGLYLDGTTLYMGLSTNVSTIDINSPGVPDVLIGAGTTISDLELNGTDLYYADINNNKIMLYDLTTASVSKYNTLGITMYPNPSNDFIKISGLTNTASYEISNMLGAKVQTGKVSQNENINVRSLNKGMYFVKLENGASLKFIKK